MKKFFKQFGGITIGLLIFGGVFAAGSVQRNNSKLELSQFRMLFTNDGTIGGTAVFDINSGGNIVSYGPLVDSAMNPFLTGYTETDPVRMANSGLYLPLAGNTSSTAMSGDIWMGDSSEMFFGDDYYLYGGPNFIEMYGGNGSSLPSIQSYMGIDNDHKIYIWHQHGGLPIVNYGVMLGTGALEYNQDYTSVFTDRSLVDKGYVDGEMMSYVPYTAVDTGFNHTGSDTIIPSEKTVRGLVDNLTQSYIPFRSGDKMYDSPMYDFPGIGVGITGEDNGLLIYDGGVMAKYGYFSTTDYLTGYEGNSAVVRAIKHNTGWLFGGEAHNYAMGMFLSNRPTTPNSYAALSIGAWDIANHAITNSSGSNFRVDFGGNMEVKGVSTFSGNVYITGGASLYDAGGNKYITGLGYMGLTNNYIPYRSGDRLYNSNTIYNPIEGRLELGGRSGVVNYSGVALLASGGAYFYSDNMIGGFSIPISGGAGMFGWASGTGRYAGYLQTSSNAVGLRVDANSTSTAGLFETHFGTILDLNTLNGTGISINKIFSTYTGGIALNIGYDGLSNMAVDYSGNISTVGTIKIGTTTSACDGATAGTMKYSGTNFFGCNGTSRTQLDN